MWKVVENKTDEARMAETEGKEIEEREDAKRKKERVSKLTVEKEIVIVRMIEEKHEEEEDLIEIRMVEEMVPRRFHKNLKVFEKELERIPIRKT